MDCGATKKETEAYRPRALLPFGSVLGLFVRKLKGPSQRQPDELEELQLPGGGGRDRTDDIQLAKLALIPTELHPQGTGTGTPAPSRTSSNKRTLPGPSRSPALNTVHENAHAAVGITYSSCTGRAPPVRARHALVLFGDLLLEDLPLAVAAARLLRGGDGSPARSPQPSEWLRGCSSP